MKKFWLIGILLIFGIFLASCGGGAVALVEDPPALPAVYDGPDDDSTPPFVDYQIFELSNDNHHVFAVYPITPSVILNRAVRELVFGYIDEFLTNGSADSFTSSFNYEKNGENLVSLILDFEKTLGGRAVGAFSHTLVFDLLWDRLVEADDCHEGDCGDYSDERPEYDHVCGDCDCPPPFYVALTFDDGPHPQHTADLLDVLASRGVPATFFLLGLEVERYPDLVQRIFDEGHSVGNHTFRHPNLTGATRQQIRDEIDRTNRLIYDIIGETPRMFRPPFGIETPDIFAVAYEMGMSAVFWTVDPQDWLHRCPDHLRDHVTANVRHGSIVLMHDIRPCTVEGVAMAIDILLERGVNFVTVEGLFDFYDHEMEPGVIYRGFYRLPWRLRYE